MIPAVVFTGMNYLSGHGYIFSPAEKREHPAQHSLVVVPKILAANDEHLVGGEVSVKIALAGCRSPAGGTSTPAVPNATAAVRGNA